MSSDADYASFLDKANAQADEGKNQARTQGNGGGSGDKKHKVVNTAIPSALPEVDEVYVSDSDEPFERVSLSHSGTGAVSAKDVKDLLGLDKGHDVDDVTSSFDKGGQYKTIVENVKKAGNGKVAVFRVKLDGTRAQYLILSQDEGEKKIVGYAALSVES